MTTDALQIVPLDEMKIQLGEPLDDTENDSVIQSQIESAVDFVGNTYGCPLVDKTTWAQLHHSYVLKAYGVIRQADQYRFCPQDSDFDAGYTVSDIDPVRTTKEFIRVGFPEESLYRITPEFLRINSFPEVCYGTTIDLKLTYGLDNSEHLDGSSIPRQLKQAVRMCVVDYWNKAEQVSPIVAQLINSCEAPWDVNASISI